MNILPYSRQVQYYETDRMGIAHHSNYFRWMEEARLDAMKQAGIDVSELEDMGIMIPVTRIECRYIRPFHFGDRLTVSVRITSYNGIRLACGYEIFRGEEKSPAAIGASEHCFLNSQTQMPVNLTRKFARQSTILTACMQKDVNGETT